MAGHATVQAQTHVRRMKGGSDSHLIVGSDLKAYVVKFLDNPQHRLVPANEWLASHLASALGLTVPRSAIVDVSADFIGKSPDLTMRLLDSERLYTPGLQFGSEFVGGLLPGVVADYLPNSRLLYVANREEFVGALVFDLWVCNADSRQAVFVTKLSSKKSSAYFIDYGHCFGGRSLWNLNWPNLRPLYGNHIVYEGVTGLSSFDPWFARLRDIDDARLWEWFAAMPAVWYAEGPISPEALIEALVRRQREIPELILSLVRTRLHAFPSWNE